LILSFLTIWPAAVGGAFWDLLSHLSLFSVIILIILVGMSIVSWGVIFMKWRALRTTLIGGDLFRAQFRQGRRLADRLASLTALRQLPHWRLIEAGLREAAAFSDQNRGGQSAPDAWFDLSPEQKRAVSDTLSRVSQEEIGKLEQWTIFLATTGNASPFLGLLGTVWGIMNAFVGIGMTGSASLAVVAPGIAEALIATVVGLAAAIPAVVAYNWCVRKLREISDDFSNLSLEFLTELTRENAREATDIPRAV
jgi:biopolymer transport protein TolQ